MLKRARRTDLSILIERYFNLKWIIKTRPVANVSRSFSNSPAGFTLLEILIVVSILATVIALVAPKLRSTQNKATGAVRRLSVMTRFLQNQARIKQANFRIAFKTDEESKRTTYWIESGPLHAMPLSDDIMKKLDSLSKEEQERYFERQSFTKDESVMKNLREKKGEIELPSPVKLLGIEVPGGVLPRVNSMDYVYFFGQGLAQEVAIHLGDGEKLHWTIIVEPLTGRSRVYDRNAKLEEFKAQ